VWRWTYFDDARFAAGMTNQLRRRLVQAGAAGLSLWPWRLLSAPHGYPRLLQGPMIGHVGARHVTVWGRASGSYPLSVQYATDRGFTDPRTSEVVATSEAGDLTGVVRIDGLEPGTRYWYRMLVDGVVDRYQSVPYPVRTAPAGPADFTVAFGSCARHSIDAEQRIFEIVAREAPDLFFWLGDNVYADAESPLAIADEYRRQRNVRTARAVARSIPQLAIWDDHDFGYNNGDGTWPHKAGSLAVFNRYWANPSQGLADVPGVFFEYSYAGVDFFFLDGRYHRSPNDAPDGPAKTMLGSGQFAWLCERLLASRAPFKVLACGSGWSLADGPRGDTWSAFLDERNRLFDFIRDRGIDGVVCLSGDSHVGELNCIPWSERGGYDIYDLVSSPLAQSPGAGWITQSPEIRLRQVYAGGANVGLLHFRAGDAPSLRFDLLNEWGLAPWMPLDLAATELRNGVRSWPGKIDPQLVNRAPAPG
jgi:alkaline phosphatase D